MPATTSPFDLGPLGAVKGIHAFTAGPWNDEPHTRTAAGVQALQANHEALSRGATPYYTPFVSINHDTGLAFGKVSRVAAFADGRLHVDLDDVPEQVRTWMKSGQLRQPSIEYWRPGTFHMPDGCLNTSPVLRAITLLGNQAPGAKGLPPLSHAQFRDLTPDTGVARFADLPPAAYGAAPMDDKAILLQTYTDLGGDISVLNPDATPEQLQALIDMMNGAAPKPPLPSDMPPVAAFRDKTITLTGDDGTRLQAKMPAELVEMYGAFYSGVKQVGGTVRDAKTDKVARFRDEMGSKGLMTPAMLDAQKEAFAALTGPALDRHLANLRATHTSPVARFSHQVVQPAPRAPGGNRGSGGSGLTRDQLRAMTPEGKKILETQKS